MVTQDKTTEGHTASAREIEGMLRNLCAYALSDPDPLQRYLDLTHQQVLFDGLVAVIRRERGKALADLAGIGVPLGKVAELAGLDTIARAKALITASGVSVPTQRRSASKQRKPAVVQPTKATTPKPVSTPKPVAAPKSVAPNPGTEATAEPTPKSGAKAKATPMLPPTIVPGGKRTLTAEERAVLGLTHVGHRVRTTKIENRAAVR